MYGFRINKNIKTMRLTIFILSTLLFSQQKYPVDSLLKSETLPATKKIGLIPIAIWQRLSYNTDAFNCQFYPSCSNYASVSISQFGIIKGSIVALDRVTRCNPFAHHYHLKLNRPFYEKDGRLIDTIKQKTIKSSSKNPYFAGFLSTIIPGLGRIYSGRTIEGILGMATTLMLGNSTFKNLKHQKSLTGKILGITTIFIYGSEIYGAWRTAKYYQKNEPMT